MRNVKYPQPVEIDKIRSCPDHELFVRLGNKEDKVKTKNLAYSFIDIKLN